MSNLMPVYQPQPMTLSHGEGCYVWDMQGRRYLDTVSGVGVTLLGHAHPQIQAAITAQTQQFLHVSNLYRHPWNEQLAHQLSSITGLPRTFFCNSGAEANETAIKLARAYGHQRGIQQPKIIVMHNGFHGRTLGALSATFNPQYRQDFAPLLDGFIFVPFHDLAAVAQHANNPDVVAVMLEPIQGEGGVHIASALYLQQLRQFCDAQQWLLICDEIQCGMGRTGKWLYSQHADIQPDIVTLAKGLGNGLPIGACLSTNALAGLLQQGRHGSTFGGNPLACRVACTVLDVIETQHLAQIAQQGDRLLEILQAKLTGLSNVQSVRGVGLMLAIELQQPIADLCQLASTQCGLLLNVIQHKVIRLLPPYIITEQQMDDMAGQIAYLLKRLQQSNGMTNSRPKISAVQ